MIVTVAKSARQVVEVLNLNGSEVDIVLAEVEVPKGFKMLKHVTKEEKLKRIPIVMMSCHDEMSVVMKCLWLGAADYLVKPLGVNELLNSICGHTCGDRGMLVLAERSIITGSLTGKDFFVSDTSESNTVSTDLFSDDSNDKKLDMSNECASYYEPQLDSVCLKADSYRDLLKNIDKKTYASHLHYPKQKERYGCRAMMLEAVAAVPVMVSGMILHCRSLRKFEHNGGWIKVLLEEAENERMHFMTFMEVSEPKWYERALVFTTGSFLQCLLPVVFGVSAHCA